MGHVKTLEILKQRLNLKKTHCLDCVSSIIVPKRTAPKITLWKSSGRQNPRSKPHPLVYTLFLFDRCIINYSKCFKDTQRCSQISLPIAEKRIATKFKDLSIITLNKNLWREINDMGVFYVHFSFALLLVYFHYIFRIINKGS